MSKMDNNDDIKDFNNIVSQSVDLSNAYVRNDILTVTRSVRDININKNRQFLYHIPLSNPIKLPPTEISNIVHRIPSPSGEKLAIIRSIKEDKEQHVLEIWNNNGTFLQSRIILPTLINTDFNLFGNIAWNKQEDNIVYVGTKKQPTYSTYFEKSQDESTIIGNKYTLNQGIQNDYGEKYTIENSYPVFYLVQLIDCKVTEITNVPKKSVGQVQFSPCGYHIIYTGWDLNDRKLGITYCQQRPCKLYTSSLHHLFDSSKEEKEAMCLTLDLKLAFSPCITGDKLFYLASTKGFDTHFGCLELHSLSFSNNTDCIIDLSSQKVIIDNIQKVDTSNTKLFPGLFMTNIPKECTNEKYLYLNTIWHCMNRIIKVNLNDSSYEVLFDDEDESHSCLCATKNGLVYSCSAPDKPPVVKYVGDVDNSSHGTVLDVMDPIAISSYSSLENMILSNLIEYKVYSTPIPCILYLPKNKNQKIPLIVVPHGGPHSALTTQFLPSYSYLCSSGQYAILLINFRGSIGYGSKFLTDLPGTIGNFDVQDVVTATNHIVQQCKDVIDADRVGICGGSHGGFLASHCIGQYPDLYKVAALRNPVTDIPSMIASTDIPDWCFIESLGAYPINEPNTTFQPTKEELCNMYDMSPIAYIQNVRAPTILALGASDKRVPMRCQGLEYYYRLKSLGVYCKCLVYEKDGHALDNPVTESDHWVNVKRWFDSYL